jgi:hypothetical protein
VDEHLRQKAEGVRELILRRSYTPAQIRNELVNVPVLERDAWVDVVLGLDQLPADGPELPPGCVPYLPCAVDVLLRIAALVPVGADDVFVDIGSGVGRAAVLMHLLTGASSRGIEVQSGHVQAAHGLVDGLGLSGVTFVQGDAVSLPAEFAMGTVFFLYCPFSGQRLMHFLQQLEGLAWTREPCVCTVDLPLPACSWLEQVGPDDGDLRVFRGAKRKLFA